MTDVCYTRILLIIYNIDSFKKEFIFVEILKSFIDLIQSFFFSVQKKKKQKIFHLKVFD